MATQTYAAQTLQNKTFYDRALIERLLPSLVFMKHGAKKAIPKRDGATIDFRKFSSLSSTPLALVEGVTPSGESLTIANVTATVAGYGNYVIVSDLLDMAGIDPVITESVQLLGEQAGEWLDTIVRDVVKAGSNSIRVNGRAVIGDVVAGDIMDGATLRKVRRTMKYNKVKEVAGAGAYLGFVHPYVAHDIMGDSAWVNANQYAGTTKIFDGEIGKMYGVRYIETTLAPVFAGKGNGGIDVYGTIVIGSGGYAVADIAGSSKPETIVKQLGSGGSEDPLNQRATVGWKAYLAAVRLEELAILRVESAVSS